MATPTPTVNGITLMWRDDTGDHTISLGTPAWYAWLETATAFAFASAQGTFTARKERRQRGGWYWKATRKAAGKLHRYYLGKTADLTLERLSKAAAALAAADHQHAAPPPPDLTAQRATAPPRTAALPDAGPPPSPWPVGTVTFLFTDIAGSAHAWEHDPAAMSRALARHDALLRAAIGAHGGEVFKTVGDSFHAVFVTAGAALAGAMAAQRALAAEDWGAEGLPDGQPLRVRMALHTGVAEIREADYFGQPLNRTARILALGHGEQILLSHTTADLVADALPPGAELRDLGTHQLKDLSRPEQIFQLVCADLPAEFPPLRLAGDAEAPSSPTVPILATKLSIPPTPRTLIARPRLVARLREGLTARLTLVTAPAGFGKTTLLADWLQSAERGAQSTEQPTTSVRSALERSDAPRFAWVTLDAGDNDPVRFWSSVIAALETIRPGIGAAALALLQAPKPPPIETVLTALLNTLTRAADRSPADIVLVLDDYHAITAPAIHSALATLLAYLPLQLHLVIASRTDPPLPLPRLRARGQLVELRASDLRCSADEARALLTAILAIDLSAEDAAALAERTEGWAAGLQLAALALVGQPDPRHQIATLRGDNRYIWDYLLDEVLDQQPDDVRQFLLGTAILDRLCAPLCDAVLSASEHLEPPTADPLPGSPFARGPVPGGAQAMLEGLERANLFIAPLDAERRWYRYHRLFAEVLQARLNQTQPELEPLLHRRAAAWYRQQGLTADAIRHALTAADWPTAAALIEQQAEALLMRGEGHTLLDWIAALPDEVARARPHLCVCCAGALLLIESRHDAAEQWLTLARQRAAPGDALQTAEIAAVEAWLVGSYGEIERAAGLARSALHALPAERPFLRALATLALGGAALSGGDLLAARQELVTLLAQSQATGNRLIDQFAGLMLGLLQLLAGQLHQAQQTYQRARQQIAGGAPSGALAGIALAWLSELHYEWNDLGTAARYADEAVSYSQLIGNHEQLAFSYAVVARVAAARGAVDEAIGAISQALQHVELLATRAPERDQIRLYQVRLWLRQGQLAAAAAWAQERGPTGEEALTVARELELLTVARVAAAQGGDAARQALPLLSRLLAADERAGRTGRVIETLAVRASAYVVCGEQALATADLTRALALAAPEGYTRLFVDLGAPMGQALQAALDALRHQRDAPPALLEYVRHLLAAFAQEAPDPHLPAPRTPHATLPEPLSEREREVLCLLAEGRSNQAIAAQLIVGFNPARPETLQRTLVRWDYSAIRVYL